MVTSRFLEGNCSGPSIKRSNKRRLKRTKLSFSREGLDKVASFWNDSHVNRWCIFWNVKHCFFFLFFFFTRNPWDGKQVQLFFLKFFEVAPNVADSHHGSEWKVVVLFFCLWWRFKSLQAQNFFLEHWKQRQTKKK